MSEMAMCVRCGQRWEGDVSDHDCPKKDEYRPPPPKTIQELQLEALERIAAAQETQTKLLRILVELLSQDIGSKLEQIAVSAQAHYENSTGST